MSQIFDDESKNDSITGRLRHISPGDKFKLHNSLWQRCIVPKIDKCPEQTENFWVRLDTTQFLCIEIKTAKVALLSSERVVEIEKIS